METILKPYDPAAPDAEAQAWGAGLLLANPPADFDTPLIGGLVPRQVAAENYRAYYEHRKARGLEPFPTEKAKAARAQTQELRKAYSGLDQLKTNLKPEAWQQLELGGQGEQDPEEFYARAVNANFLKTMVGRDIPPEALDDVRDAYARQHLGLEGDITDKAVYQAIQSRHQEDDTDAAAFGKALEQTISKRLGSVGKFESYHPGIQPGQVPVGQKQPRRSLEWKPNLEERDAILATISERNRPAFRAKFDEVNREMTRIIRKHTPLVEKITAGMEDVRESDDPERAVLLYVSGWAEELPDRKEERDMVLAMLGNALESLPEDQRGYFRRLTDAVRRGPKAAATNIVQFGQERGRAVLGAVTGRETVYSLDGSGRVVKNKVKGADGFLSDENTEFLQRRAMLLDTLRGSGMNLKTATDNLIGEGFLLAGGSAWMSPATFTPLGQLAIASTLAGESLKQAAEENPDVPELARGNAAQASGMVQGAIESFSNIAGVKILTGKLPRFSALLNRANITSPAGRAALGFVAGKLSIDTMETGEEIAQGATDMMFQGLAADLSGIDSERDWGKYFKDWATVAGPEHRDTLLAVMAFGMIGGAGASYNHFKYGAALARNKTFLRAHGFTEAEVRDITSTTDLDEAAEKTRKAFDESLKRGPSLSEEEKVRQEKLRKESIEVFKASAEAYERMGMPIIEKRRNDFEEKDVFTFIEPVTGERTEFETEEEAIGAWQDWNTAQSQENIEAIQEAGEAGFIESVLGEGSITEDVNVERVNKTVTPGTELAEATADVTAAETDKRRAITAAQERKAREKAESAKERMNRITARVEGFLLERGVDPTNAQAVGRALDSVVIKAKSFATMLQGKVVGYTVQLFNGAEIQDIAEDISETAMKIAVDQGFADPEIILDDIRRYEAAAGVRVIDPSYEYDPGNTLPLVEGFSKLARAVLMGNVRTGLLPPEVAAWIEMQAALMAVSVDLAKAGGAGSQFAMDVQTAAEFREAVAAGKVPLRLQRLLMDSLGLDQDARMSRLERKMEEQMAAEAMGGFPEIREEAQGRLPHPETLRENNHPLYGEVRRIWESLLKPTKRRTKEGKAVDRTNEANAFFLPVGVMEDLDKVRQALNERGFVFDLITDMLDALDVSISYDKPFYGTASVGEESWAMGSNERLDASGNPQGIDTNNPGGANIGDAALPGNSGVIYPKGRPIKMEKDWQANNGDNMYLPDELRPLAEDQFGEPSSISQKLDLLEIQHAAKNGNLYVRWTEGFKTDKKSGFQSLDALSGNRHAGISAVNIDPEWPLDYLEKRLNEYEFLRMKGDAKPFIIEGAHLGLDTDGYDQIYPTQYLGTWDQKSRAISDPAFNQVDANAPNSVIVSIRDPKIDGQSITLPASDGKENFNQPPPADSGVSYAMSSPGLMRLENAIAKRMTRGPDERAEYFQKLRDRLASTVLMLRESKRNIATDQSDTERERNRIRDAMAEASAIIKALPMEARGRVPYSMNDILDADTETGQINGLIRLIDKADEALEAVLLKEYRESFETLLDLAKPDLRQNKQVRGRLTPETQKMVGRILDAVVLSPAELAVALASKQAEIDALEASTPTDPDVIKASQEKLVALYQQQSILETFGAFGNLDAAGTAHAYEQLQSIYITGRTARKILDEARRQKIEAAKAELLSNLAEVDQATHAESMANNGVGRELSSWRLGMSSFHQVMEWLFPRSTTARDLQDRVRKADRAFVRAKIDAKDRFDRFTFGVWGLAGRGRARARNKILAQLSTLRDDWGIQLQEGVSFTSEKLTEEQASKILAGEMKPGWETDRIAMISLQQALADFRMQRLKAQNEDRQFRSKVIRFQRLTRRGTPGPFVASDLQALYFLQLYAQEQYRPALDKYGFSEDVMTLMESKLNPKARDLGDFLRDEYDSEWNRLNPVYRAIYGLDMPKIRNYAPGSFEHLDAKGPGTDSTIDPTGPAAGVNAMSAGFTKARTHHMARPQQSNAMAKYWSHLESTEYFIAYAEVVRDARQIFRNPEVRRRIEGKHGPKVAALFSQWLDAIEVDGNFRASEMQSLAEMTHRTLATQSAVGLAYNLAVPLKQLSASFGVMWEMGAKDAVTGLVLALQNPQAFRAVWNSEAVQQRVLAGISPEDRRLLEAANASPSMIMDLLEMGRLPIAYSDAAFTTLGAAVAYAHHRAEAIKAGLSPAAADAAALAVASRVIERTAQPATTQDKSMAELTARGFGKFLFLFKSDTRQKLAISMNAMAALLDGRMSGPKAAKTLFWTWAMYGLSAEVMTDIWQSMSRDDDDEDRWSWQDYLASMIAGPISGLPLLGSMVEWGIRATIGTKAFNSSPNPIDQATRIPSATRKVMEEITADDLEISDVLTRSQQLASAIALGVGAFDSRAAIVPAALRLTRDAYGMVTNFASLFMEPTADDAALEIIKPLADDQKVQREDRGEDFKAMFAEISKLPADERMKRLEKMPPDDRGRMVRKLKAAQMTPSEAALSRLTKENRAVAIEKIMADMNERERDDYQRRLQSLGLMR